MRMTGRATRGVALMTGAVVTASMLFHPAPVQAAEKSKTYKTGAIVLGAVGAYFILKGKTVPAAVAGAGAYYAYKKSKDAKREERYGKDSSSQDRYPEDPYFSRNSSTDVDSEEYDVAGYPGDPGYDGAYNGLRRSAPSIASRRGAQSNPRTVLK